MFEFFVGMLVGGGIFAATLWSAAQIYQQRGNLQKAHGACLAIVLCAMATLSAVWPDASVVCGVLLIPAALAALWWEIRWNKVLPVFHLMFAAALLARLPFGG